MNKLDDSYFYTFKLNILSGRQTPVALGSLFRGIIFAQFVAGGMSLFMAPALILNEQIIHILAIGIVSNIVIVTLFSFKWLYTKFPKIQYLIFNINTLLFSFCFIIMGGATFFSSTDGIKSYDEYRTLVFGISNTVGVIALFISFFIFRNNAIKGNYQEDSRASEKMIKNELVGKILTPILILSSISVPFIIKSLIPSNSLMFGFMGSLLIFLGCVSYVGTSWTFMTFYCKLRFKSFNLDISELIKDGENERLV
ncbi:hypothetical protein [uncultured Vagococcus sp.]|uniref:hypothetical protein n=1 Tax=uncultured Vagococcus sp. TaxID=189676 RepID=UPI0028D13102|nr:hypothetical protein [uncultured Vagococcus sp.]